MLSNNLTLLIISTNFHISHYFISVLAIKRWITNNEDIQYDSTAPQVAFFVIFSLKNFWGNIIGLDY